MCIAILNKTGIIPEEYLFNSYSNNPDGIGIIWSQNNTLYTFKTFDYDEFVTKYYSIRDRIQTPIALHFRIATSGKIDLKNCHPFVINKNLAFIHNGIIPKLGNAIYSDTFIYNETRLKKLQNNFLQSRIIKEKISKEIGYSKLVFLDNNAYYTIINEHFGHWRDDNWYSNDSYKYETLPDFTYNDSDYYSNFFGDLLPPYFDQLTPPEQDFIYELLDDGLDTPPDYIACIQEYQNYCAYLEELEESQYIY